MIINQIKCSLAFKKACDKCYGNYETIALYGTNQAQKIFLGDKNNQVCRFCGRKKERLLSKKKSMLYPI